MRNLNKKNFKLECYYYTFRQNHYIYRNLNATDGEITKQVREWLKKHYSQEIKDNTAKIFSKGTKWDIKYYEYCADYASFLYSMVDLLV